MLFLQDLEDHIKAVSPPTHTAQDVKPIIALISTPYTSISMEEECLWTSIVIIPKNYRIPFANKESTISSSPKDKVYVCDTYSSLVSNLSTLESAITSGLGHKKTSTILKNPLPLISIWTYL